MLGVCQSRDTVLELAGALTDGIAICRNADKWINKIVRFPQPVTREDSTAADFSGCPGRTSTEAHNRTVAKVQRVT